ncbi:MAG: acetamidase/formamidase family protein [Rhodothermus sp.]|nr:acetamidase/formamidase family protein [Rhodothermus sp.]
MMKVLHVAWLPVLLGVGVACRPIPTPTVPEPQYRLTAEQTHNKFSRRIAPVLRVPAGAIIELELKEATDGQLTPTSTADDILRVSFDPIHPLTGPIYVEGAEPGDVLAVTIHRIELEGWGWAGIFPGFGFLADTFTEPFLKIFQFDPTAQTVDFGRGFRIPLRPFPGVIGVAPDTDSLLSTIPPRANGGNMDNPFLTVGTTVYLPVFVEGALLSLGDPHAAQGLGEVSGTAIEAPMRVVIEVQVLKDRSIPEPQYETDAYYAVTAFATTLDEAARKATRYMIDHLVQTYGLRPEEAYILCSLAGELHIAEVVDVPHVLVAMHLPKTVLPSPEARN